MERHRGSKPLRLPYLAFLSSASSFLRFLSLFLSRLLLKYLFKNCCVNLRSFPRPPSVRFFTLSILPGSRPFVPPHFLRTSFSRPYRTSLFFLYFVRTSVRSKTRFVRQFVPALNQLRRLCVFPYGFR